MSCRHPGGSPGSSPVPPPARPCRRNCQPIVVVVQRSKAAIFVVDAKAAAERHSPHRAAGVALNRQRTPASASLDPFLVAFEDLHGVGRHVFQSLQRQQMNGAGSRKPGCCARGVEGDLSQHRARDIVSHIAAPDHHHLPPNLHGLPQGHRPQEIDAAVDSWPTLAGQAQASRVLCSHGQNHGTVVAPQFRQGDISADRDALLNADAKRLDDRHFPTDQVAGKR